MSDAQKLIAAVLRSKLPDHLTRGGYVCVSDLAAEVDKALGGLTRQSGCDMSTKWLDGTRWVSGWTVTE